MVWWPLLLLVGLLCVCSFICFGFFVLRCLVSFVGALHVGLCRFCLVLGLLSWCTALCVSVSSVLSCVWCLVSLVGALHIVLVSVLSVCVPVCVFVQFFHQVGRVRFPGEVGELAPYGGAPYLRWANSDGFVLYPRYG